MLTFKSSCWLWKPNDRFTSRERRRKSSNAIRNQEHRRRNHVLAQTFFWWASLIELLAFISQQPALERVGSQIESAREIPKAIIFLLLKNHLQVSWWLLNNNISGRRVIRVRSFIRLTSIEESENCAARKTIELRVHWREEDCSKICLSFDSSAVNFAHSCIANLPSSARHERKENFL